MHSKIHPKPRKSSKNLKFLFVLIAIVFLALIFLLTQNNSTSNTNQIQGKAILKSGTSERVSLAELKNDVYPEFTCSCCGNTINQCTCGMAKGMKEYINTLAENNLSKEDIILESAKKFGLNSLADNSLKETIQKKLIENAPADRPIINIEPLVYNFGTISQSKDIINTIFTIKNDGKSDLIIDNMKSSCHCTTASIIYNDIEGPRFGMLGMHDNPTDWQISIKPGETAQLKVYYDPNAHGEFRGLATRTIDISSNDPVSFQKQIRIELNQVP